ERQTPPNSSNALAWRTSACSQAPNSALTLAETLSSSRRQTQMAASSSISARVRKALTSFMVGSSSAEANDDALPVRNRRHPIEAMFAEVVPTADHALGDMLLYSALRNS